VVYRYTYLFANFDTSSDTAEAQTQSQGSDISLSPQLRAQPQCDISIIPMEELKCPHHPTRHFSSGYFSSCSI